MNVLYGRKKQIFLTLKQVVFIKGIKATEYMTDLLRRVCSPHLY